jgi:hypothetical protein
MASDMRLDDRLESLARAVAAEKQLPQTIVRALVIKESTARMWAWNPEPRYRYFWDVKRKQPFRRVTESELLSKFPPKDFPAPPGVDPDAEWWGQQASWGYMQVMGGVARECGYSGEFLGGLYDPAVNLEISCRHLKDLSRRYLATAGWQGVVAAYNAGSPRVQKDGRFENQKYVDDVLNILGVWPD